MYIPDITERFPEGFGGVDMTPSFFGEPVDYRYEPSYEELCEDGEYGYEERNYNMLYHDEDEVAFPRTEPLTKQFEIGNEYTVVGIYGGVTTYKVDEIDRENNKILLSEYWFDVDGEGTRPAQWHELVENDNGNEMALEWESKEYGKFWIHA